MPEIVFPSPYLKINVNVKPGDIIRFKDTGTLETERDTWEFKVEIYHDGIATETKQFTLNKTNFKVVSGLYGTNSDGWLEKEVMVNTIKVRNPATGLLVDSIALSAPSPTTSAPAV